MILLGDFLGKLATNEVRQHQKFLATLTSEERFCVAPRDVGCADNYPLVALYEKKTFQRQANATEMLLPTAGRKQTLRTSLNSAFEVIEMLFDQPQWFPLIHRVDDSTTRDDIFQLLQLDPNVTMKKSVAAWSSGEFLAPHEGGFAAFLVGIRGDLSMLSVSDEIFPVALHLKLATEAERSDLTGRKVRVAPFDES